MVELTSYPHCDPEVCHAPGECRYCDEMPILQEERVAKGTNFTGHNDIRLKPCPATERRPFAVINRWYGNRAAK